MRLAAAGWPKAAGGHRCSCGSHSRRGGDALAAGTHSSRRSGTAGAIPLCIAVSVKLLFVEVNLSNSLFEQANTASQMSAIRPLGEGARGSGRDECFLLVVKLLSRTSVVPGAFEVWETMIG